MDTHKRTVVKVISYRIWVGITAFITAMVLNHSTAFGLTFLIGSFTIGALSFWIQERVWNRFRWGQVGTNDKHRRTIAKTITWRLFSLIVLFFVALILGLNQEESLVWTIVVNISFIVVHYLHERVWNMIKWGKVLPESKE